MTVVGAYLAILMFWAMIAPKSFGNNMRQWFEEIKEGWDRKL
jgi:hypothetical protein